MARRRSASAALYCLLLQRNPRDVEIALRGIVAFDQRQQTARLIDTAAREAGRLHVILEKVVQSLPVIRVQLNGLLERLPAPYSRD